MVSHGVWRPQFTIEYQIHHNTLSKSVTRSQSLLACADIPLIRYAKFLAITMTYALLAKKVNRARLREASAGSLNKIRAVKHSHVICDRPPECESCVLFWS